MTQEIAAVRGFFIDPSDPIVSWLLITVPACVKLALRVTTLLVLYDFVSNHADIQGVSLNHWSSTPSRRHGRNGPKGHVRWR
jgi:hypothetical protein